MGKTEQSTTEPLVMGEQSTSERFAFLKTRWFSKAIVCTITVAGIFYVMTDDPNDGSASDSTMPDLASAVVPAPRIQLPAHSEKPDGEISRHTKRERKKQKNAKAVAYSGPQAIQRPRNMNLPPGVRTKAILETGASDGPVKAVIKDAVRIDGEERIEAGSVLIGTGQSGKHRLLVRFTELVFRDGAFARIRAQALDGNDEIAGIKGSNVSAYGLKLAAAAGLNFIAGLSEGLKEKQKMGEHVVEKSTVSNALLNGSSKAAMDQSSEVLRDLKSEKPRYEVAKGTQIIVLFEDVRENK